MKYRIKEIKHRKCIEYLIQYNAIFGWRKDSLPFGYRISSLREAQEILKDRQYVTKIKYYYE